MTARATTLDTLARIGYAVKGVVYALVGALALQVALGTGGQTTDTTGAIATLRDEAFGTFALWAIAIGLGAYVLWRLAQAILDTDGEGRDGEGVAHRLAHLGSAVLNGGVALAAAQMAMGQGTGSSDAPQDWTARVLSWPAGAWIVGAAALVVLGMAAYQAYRAYTARFMSRMDGGDMDAATRRWLERIGRFGIGARAVVFALVGVFIGVAAWQSDPSEVRGIEGALDALRAWGPGPYLLGIVALGLLAYAAYCLGTARYRRFDPK